MLTFDRSFLFCLLLILGISSKSEATHIVGGELNYSYLGNDNYKIHLTVYRDCYNGIPPFDDPAYVGIWDAANNLIMEVAMSPNDSATVPSVINSPCFQPPGGICVRVANYYAVVNLPPIPGGYQLAYQRCCRNQTILNVVNPLSTGASFYAFIPGSGVANSNPVFSALPPAFICNGYTFTFDHSATDADGDSLVYSICTPYDGANQGNSAPLPSQAPPPFLPITFQAPFSASNLLGGIPLSIDPVTGELTALPNTLGQFVIGICVSEYRNGQLLSTTLRDYQLNVVDCPSLVVAAMINPQISCGSNTINFSNTSQGASSYFWNFYDPTNPNSTSTAVNPSWTYPDTGTYYVSLIAYSSLDPSCSDTTGRVVIIHPDYIPEFSSSQTACSYTVSFNDSSNTGGGLTNFWNWDFGDGSIHSNLPDPTHTYAGPGTYLVTLVAQSTLYCRDTVRHTITIPPPVQFLPIMGGPTDGCQGSTPPALPVSIATSTGQSLAPYQINYTLNGVAQPPLTTTSNQAIIYPPTSLVGNYLYQITGISSVNYPGCPVSGTTTHIFNTIPDAAATIGSSVTVCKNEPATITFTGSGNTAPYTFTYTINNGPDQIAVSPAGSSTATIPVNTTSVGSLIYQLVNVAGSTVPVCITNQSGTATITVVDAPNASLATDTNAVCQGGIPPVVTFTGNGSPPPFTFTYNINGGATQSISTTGSNSTASITIPTSTPGAFDIALTSVTGTSPATCVRPLSQHTVVNVIPLPDADISGTTSVCRNSPDPVITLTGSNNLAPYTFTYSVNGGAAQTATSSGPNFTIPVSANAAGTFNYQLISVTGSSNPVCTSGINKSATVTVRELPDASISGPDSLCLFQGNGLLTFSGIGGTPPYTFNYTLNGGPVQNVTSSGTAASITIPTLFAGNVSYILTGVQDSGAPSCAKTISKPKDVFIESVGADFSSSPKDCPYSGVIKFNNQTANGSTWYWDFGDGSTTSEPSPVHAYMNGGDYTIIFIAVSESGCRDTVLSDITVLQPFTLWMPNTFTPNGDGRNEKFFPVTLSGGNFSMTLYNRWGQPVFYTNDPDIGWDGTLNGVPSPEGVYVYQLSSEDLCGNRDVRRGAFMLIR